MIKKLIYTVNLSYDENRIKKIPTTTKTANNTYK